MNLAGHLFAKEARSPSRMLHVHIPGGDCPQRAIGKTGGMAIEEQAQPQAGMTGRRSLASNTLTGALARGLYGASLLVGSVFVAQFQGVDAVGSFGLAVVLATFAAAIADCGMSQYLIPRLAQSSPDEWGPILGTIRSFQLRSALPAALIFSLVVAIAYTGQDRLTLLATIPLVALHPRDALAALDLHRAGERVIRRSRGGRGDGGRARPARRRRLLARVACLDLARARRRGSAWAWRFVYGRSVGSGLAAGTPDYSHPVLLRETWHFNTFSVLVLVYSRIDVILLSLLATSAELGIYQGPVRIVTGILLLPEALSLLLQARTSRTPGDRALHAAQQRVLSIAVLASLPFIGLVALFGGDLLGLIYGEPFAAANLAFVLLVAIVPIRLVNYLNGNQLVAHDYQSVRVSQMALTAVFAVAAGTVAIYLYGYNGAAAITLAAEALLFVLYIVAVRRRLGPKAVLYPFDDPHSSGPGLRLGASIDPLRRDGPGRSPGPPSPVPDPGGSPEARNRSGGSR